MNALFQELGPCLVSPSNTSTPRPTSFNNAASVLFIDQPAGVGFSQIHPSSPYVQTDQEAAADLATFLTLFFKNVFPGRAHLPIHFAGESYAGHYVPSTVKHILDERSVNARDAFWGNITSVVLVSPVLVDYQIYYGLYQLMCTTYRGHSVRWNESTCSLVERKTPAFDVMQVQCDAGNISTCRDLGDKYLDVWGILADEEDAGIRDTHNGICLFFKQEISTNIFQSIEAVRTLRCVHHPHKAHTTTTSTSRLFYPRSDSPKISNSHSPMGKQVLPSAHQEVPIRP